MEAEINLAPINLALINLRLPTGSTPLPLRLNLNPRAPLRLRLNLNWLNPVPSETSVQIVCLVCSVMTEITDSLR
jgi:hypothetical protein